MCLKSVLFPLADIAQCVYFKLMNNLVDDNSSRQERREKQTINRALSFRGTMEMLMHGILETK